MDGIQKEIYDGLMYVLNKLESGDYGSGDSLDDADIMDDIEEHITDKL